jgi:hypothetical protein
MDNGIKDAEVERDMTGLRTDRDWLYCDLPSPHGGV